MKAIRSVLNYLQSGNVSYVFGIPAGSVNAFFDELYDIPTITPIVAKHEGAASYMAAAYAKYSQELAVCIASSGPGGTNLLTGAANAMREHLPILFLTGSVPVNTVGLNASQELDAVPLYQPITKYSVRVDRAEDLLSEVHKACEIALSGVPGPVHVALPIDVQLEDIPDSSMPAFPVRTPLIPDFRQIEEALQQLSSIDQGYIFAGQGVRGSVADVLELAERLNWPIITSPQAKGLFTDEHPLFKGVFGFAGHESASELVNEGDKQAVIVLGSSLGETATNNWNPNITKDKFTIQIDFDKEVFGRKYPVDLPILGDVSMCVSELNNGLKRMGYDRKTYHPQPRQVEEINGEYSTKNVLLTLQEKLPATTRYTIDIGEFMSYVIHHMNVLDQDSFDINVHFGAMGSGIGSAIGAKLANPERPTVSITGDGCFFMHGMELLTAKEYNIPVLFVIMNNARLGMVHHGHSLQYKRAHERFAQQPVDIAAMARTLGVPSMRVDEMSDLDAESIENLLNADGPAILEVALVDDRVPPMGDRVKFLSSFGK
ncbi:thiamine pyrophosphate-binding protein [Halobacillus amylolyticus]|uniref:Thiamine pyrophosphate-binding protein n=1 Tax=Halobacillus amylolyticus TaxID=2932259 RepID=A0ABY4H966_9BACI|nr:thiamine pyrophosphate-binding protein [Halobacillus amylolyticus]UOR10485.1 thiamine pyrophosphate-binding protein [Halobacillus amylolyticus]